MTPPRSRFEGLRVVGDVHGDAQAPEAAGGEVGLGGVRHAAGSCSVRRRAKASRARRRPSSGSTTGAG